MVSIQKKGPHGGLREVGTGTLKKNVLTTTLVLDNQAQYFIDGAWYSVQPHEEGSKLNGCPSKTGDIQTYLIKRA